MTTGAAAIHRIAPRQGVEIVARRWGDIGSPSIVMAHGNGLVGAMWQPVAELLPEFTSVAIDFSGFGDSVRPDDEPANWDQLAAEILAVVDEMDPAPRIGIGHSMGAACLVLSELSRPGTFDHLFLFEPIVLPNTHEGPSQLAAITRRRREVFESYADAQERFSTKPPLNHLNAVSLDAYVTLGFAEQPDGSVRLKADRDYEADNYEAGHLHDAWERFGEVASNTVIATGAMADDGVARFGPEQAERLPNARLVSFPSLSHFGPFEDPAAIADAVRAMIAS